MYTKPITDLRARRTRKWLQAALLELMQEKPFRDIQITEIADRAEVSRPAFYLHFNSKEKLLLSHVDEVFDEFRAELAKEISAGRVDRKRFSVMLFEYWERHADTLKLVIQADAQHALLEQLRQNLAAVMADLDAQKDRPVTDPIRHAFVVDFMAGGAYMLLTGWIAQDRPVPAEQMGRLLTQLTRSCEVIR